MVGVKVLGVNELMKNERKIEVVFRELLFYLVFKLFILCFLSIIKFFLEGKSL